MPGVAWVVASIVMVAAVGSAGDLHLLGPDRTPVRWQEWLEERGPSAVLVWAPWAPGADDSLRAVDDIRKVAAENDLDMVIVAVQEEFDEALKVLGRSTAPWLHDRHGAILKEYRLIEVPALIVVDGEGRVQAKLEATAAALREWPVAE